MRNWNAKYLYVGAIMFLGSGFLALWFRLLTLYLKPKQRQKPNYFHFFPSRSDENQYGGSLNDLLKCRHPCFPEKACGSSQCLFRLVECSGRETLLATRF